MESFVDWLLEGDPWVQYQTRLCLLNQPETHPETVTARRAMLADPLIQGLLAELQAWPGSILTSHKSAGHLLHKLTFAADLGLKADDAGVGSVIDRIMAHRSETGPFQVLMNIPKVFGGSGDDQWAWALCDAPLLLYALVRFGMGDDPLVQEAVTYLASLVRENGWGCSSSPELGRFRGPGRKDDPCPFANLIMLKTLARLPEWRGSQASRIGVQTLLGLWETRRESHPYMFYMGTDFCKLKAPLVWYDILHVADVLSSFEWARDDPRLIDMVGIIQAKADGEGRFIAESIWTAWKAWDFGQKKAPSRWLTLLALKVLGRMQV